MRQVRSKMEARQLRKDWRVTMDSGVKLCFLAQDWEDAYNVGGLFRLADGVDAAEIVLTGRTPAPPNPMIGVTSLGAHRRVPFRTFDKYDVAADQLVSEGWSLVAVEIADEAASYRDYHFPNKTCLVLGNEATGVSPSLMKKVAGCVFIPMFGKGRSLNVLVAGAVVAYEAKTRTETQEI